MISGRFDSDDYLYVAGRMKDLINRRHQRRTKRYRESLLLYSDVVDAAVVGEPDAGWGETIKAYVVPREERRFSETDLIGFCKEYLADYKAPKQIRIVTDLNRNEARKTNRQGLKSRSNTCKRTGATGFACR